MATSSFFSLRRLILPALLLACPLLSTASTVTRATFRSTVLNTDIKYIVACPSSYGKTPGVRYPVLYLLHCAGCDAEWWMTAGAGPHNPQVGNLVDSVRFILVIPYDGFGMSWWLDGPVRANSRYSTFLSTELKRRIDSLYTTYPDRANTAISGQSMGGFGAIHNLIEHPDVFGAAVMLKSAVDVTLPLGPLWPQDFGLNALLGTDASSAVNWRRVNPILNSGKLSGKSFALRIYNGRDDQYFYQENLHLHRKLDSLKLVHTYIEVPEPHNDCSRVRMLEVLRVLDATFVYGATSVEGPAGSLFAVGKTGAGVRGARSAGVLVNMRGQVLRDCGRSPEARFRPSFLLRWRTSIVAAR